jgi:hypothetical protein
MRSAGLPWIQVDANLPSHRKCIRLAARVSDDDAWRFLVRLWSWASQNEPEGIIRGDDARLIVERVCGWRGDAGKLVDAFVVCRWLDETADGLAIHDWAEHQGAHIEKAKRDADRKRTARARPRIVRGRSAGRRVDGAGEKEKENREVEGDSKATSEAPPTPKFPVPTAPIVVPDDPLASGEAFFAAVQAQRAENGLPREAPPHPAKLSRWWSEALMETNGDASRIVRAYQGFAQDPDPYWRNARPPLPFHGFMSQWRKWDVTTESVRSAARS